MDILMYDWTRKFTIRQCISKNMSMKIKYIALCLLLALVGCQRDEEMEIVNATINNELIDPSCSSVSIRCNIKCNATISNVKAYVSTNQSFSSSESHALTEMSKGVYTATIDGLSDGTTYYIRYEISNRWSSISIEKVSKFTTILGTIPTITTIAATDITQNQAVVGGIIKDNGGMAVTQHGVVYSTSSSPTVESGTKVDNQVDSATFTCVLRDLSFATTYYARAYAINKKGIAYGEAVSFKTKSISAALDNISVTDVKSTSAIIKGALLHDGGEPITAMGICYGLTQSPTSANATVVNVESQGQSFSVQLSQLKKGTTYYARAFAKNRNGIAYSNEVSFNTLTEVPTVVTTSISDVSYTSVTVSGNVTDGGGLEVTGRGICYATNPSYYFTRVPDDDDSGVGEYTCNITGLQDGTTYYVRAYAINSKGYAYGEILSFTTKEKVMPTVKTTSATNISYNTATVGGAVQDDGGANVMQRGICYSTSPNPTTVSDNTAIGVGATFTCNLTGLQAGTTYYVRAFATNAKGTAYGEQVTFTTKATTTATVATIPATNVSYHSATVGGQLIDNGGIAVTESGVVYSTSQNPTTLDSKVIPERQSDEFTIDLTDLQDGTTYYVRAYAVNANGTAYGEEVSFTTNKQIVLPSVTNAAVTQITETSAVAGGNVTNDGNASVTKRGVVYSVYQNPTVSDSKVSSDSGVGQFTCNLTDLQPNTTYYVRAYAVNSQGTAYSKEVSFTTKEVSISDPTGTENGYGYVDLGLSVKWATMNVGASSPEDYGDYFAWGETEPKDYYEYSTYKWCNGSSTTLTKYNTSNSSGIVDNKMQLDLSDDAARANWGGNWRMPTDAEITELLDECTWIWIEQDGVDGYAITSKKNGNAIFLPTAGNYYDNELSGTGNFGEYWSSSLNMDYPDRAWVIYFHSTDTNRIHNTRCRGRSVRPVCPQWTLFVCKV